MIFLFLLCFIGMFYFSAGYQSGSMVTLLIQEKIKQGAIKLNLPGSVFNVFYCLFIVILAPCFTHLWLKLKNKGVTLNPLTKILSGIFLAMVGMLMFALASIIGDKLILFTIIIGYMLLSAGELVLTPAAYTAISDLAPKGMKSTMMGCWLLFVGLGGYISSILAITSHLIVTHITLSHTAYFGEFLLITLFTFLIIVIVSACMPLLLKLTK